MVQVGCARAARSLHADCVASLLRAPVLYFDSTPSGRLISRFSSDFTTADSALAQFGDNVLQFSATILAFFAVTAPTRPPTVRAGAPHALDPPTSLAFTRDRPTQSR